MPGTRKFTVGDKVRLRKDVLVRHARSVPAHRGYTTQQFRWREVIRKYSGKTGTITRIFPHSKHVNVTFPGGHIIGIDYTELAKVKGKNSPIRKKVSASKKPPGRKGSKRR